MHRYLRRQLGDRVTLLLDFQMSFRGCLGIRTIDANGDMGERSALTQWRQASVSNDTDKSRSLPGDTRCHFIVIVRHTRDTGL